MPTPPGVTFSQRLVAAFVAALVTVLLMNVAGLLGVVSSLFRLADTNKAVISISCFESSASVDSNFADASS